MMFRCVGMILLKTRFPPETKQTTDPMCTKQLISIAQSRVEIILYLNRAFDTRCFPTHGATNEYVTLCIVYVKGGVKDTGLCAQALAHQPSCIYRRGMPAMVVTAKEVPTKVVSKTPVSVLRPLLTGHCACTSGGCPQWW